MSRRIKLGLIALVVLIVGAVIFGYPRLHAEATNNKTYPIKPITIVVTFPPGGGTDLLARKLGAELEKRWHNPVIIENRPGASGNIGARYVANSSADGYTLLMVNSSFAINPAVYQSLGFDPKKDFAPIVNVAWIPSVVIVGEKSGITTLQQALQQQRQSSLAIATCGNGTPQHLAAEMLAEDTQTHILQIPYKGCGPAVADVMSGQVPLGIVTIASAMSFVDSGKLRALAVTSAEPSVVMPTVPTVMQLGIENYEMDQWHGLLAPANTPVEIMDQINNAFVDIMASEKIQHDLINLGYTPTRSTAGEFKQVIYTDIDRFGALAKRVGLQIN